MKKIIWVFFLFLSFCAKGNIVLIGSGSGTVSKTSMDLLKPGDTLGIRAGLYAGGGVFGNLHDITIINYKGVVTFTSTVDFGNQCQSMNNIKVSGSGYPGAFYGFVFSGGASYGNGPAGYPTGDGFLCSAFHYQDLVFERIEFQNLTTTQAYCIDMGHANIKYDGSNSSFKWKRGGIWNCKATNTDALLQVSYSLPKMLDNLCDSISIHDNILRNHIGNGCYVIAGITHFDIYNNKVTYDLPYKYVVADIGVFQLCGSGKLHHNYHKGGRGYMSRLFGYSLKPEMADTWIYDNIDLGTWVYGGFDVRSDSTYYGMGNPFLGPANVHVVFNTVGNKGDDHQPAFTAPIVLVTPFNDGATCEIRNNLAFSMAHPDQNHFITDYSTPNGGTTPVLSNNVYYDSSQILGKVLSDTNLFCEPSNTSLLIGAGVTVPTISQDYKYRTRNDPPSIGAMEAQGKNTTGNTKPSTQNGSLNKMVFYGFLSLSVILFGGISFWMHKKSSQNS